MSRLLSVERGALNALLIHSPRVWVSMSELFSGLDLGYLMIQLPMKLARYRSSKTTCVRRYFSLQFFARSKLPT